MKRVRVLGLLAAVSALLGLAVPTTALAGNYTWNLASDFTATAPGANPDHDQYGDTPWSYQESPAMGSHDPSTFSALPTFGMGTDGGLSTWSDQTSGALIGINPTAGPITEGTATFPAGQVVVEPGSGGQLAAIGWTSPLSQTATVSITGTIGADDTGSVACGYSTAWSIDQGGAELASGVSPATLSTSATLAPGASVFLTVSTPVGNATCDATELSLQIQATGSAPAVTLARPVSGTSGTAADPSFSGAAGDGFGDSDEVTLRVYAGMDASGAAVATVQSPRSGAAWSASLSSPLADGTYTAQAEQDDLASPVDAGLSAPVTFVVGASAGASATISLSSPGRRPLTISAPTLSGTAGTTAGESGSATVLVVPGATLGPAPIRAVTASVPASGQFSVKVPALADGTYTAVAVQAGPGGSQSFSAPETFSIDAHAPRVTFTAPTHGLASNIARPVFAGSAGSEPWDSGVVAVSLYRGARATGSPIGTLHARISGSSWSATWPSKLRAARYTARASQTDGAGHVGMSAPRTFRIHSAPPVIGSAVTIDRAGAVSLKIACNEPPEDTCSGTVLVLTQGEFEPLAGGPTGHLTLMFAFVRVEGGHDSTITRTAMPSVAALLQGHPGVPVMISAHLRPVRGKSIVATANEVLQRVGG